MARTPRKNMKDSSFFHIMVQGINKEIIFGTEDNKKKYYDLIFKNNEGIEIIAYCIMSNHVHILVYTNEIKSLEECMRKTNISYAMYYNKKNHRVGYVFRDRYKVQVIKDERHLFLCAKYIHDNPVKAGICQNSGDYGYSSFMTMYNKEELCVYDAISRILNNKNWKIEKENLEENKFELIEDDEVDKDEICRKLIEGFLIEKDLNVNDLRVETKKLKELVYILKNENNISFRMIEKNIGISREKLRKL